MKRGCIQATVLAERIRACCRESVVTTDSDQTIAFTISIGVYTDAPRQTLEQAVMHADEALYQAKRGGRDQVILGKVELST